MRVAPLLLLVCSVEVFAANGHGALEIAQTLADAGAPRLALNRVESFQPTENEAPRWANWEALRLRLLLRLGRYSEMLQRAAALPASVPVAPLRNCLELAARAAVATAQGSLARHYAARVLWRLSPSAALSKRIRRLVIQSYVGDGNGDDAFRSMLKFQQDFKPLDRETATQFVDALLQLDMPREAVNWIGSVDDESPTKLLLRLRNGFVSADAAAARAHSMLAKEDGVGYWRVLLEVAAQRKDRALQIRVQEHMLHLDNAKDQSRLAALTERLWQTYLETAREIGNQNQLLMGDDVNWADFARRRLESDPEVSRAFLAYLAQRGRTQETRDSARLLIVKSLRQDRLDLAALRLFRGRDVGTDHMAGPFRYLLGTIAEAHNLPEVALHYWRGSDVPSGLAEVEWRFRIAQVSIRAGMIDRGVVLLKAVFAGGGVVPEPIVERSVSLVRQLLDLGKFDVADGLFKVLLPMVTGAQRRNVLFDLGRVNEITGQSSIAADYYLRSALLSEGGVPDSLALRSRLLAARNLASAGYKDDARAQFEWLIKNVKDSVQLEVVRRELGNL